MPRGIQLAKDTFYSMKSEHNQTGLDNLANSVKSGIRFVKLDKFDYEKWNVEIGQLEKTVPSGAIQSLNDNDNEGQPKPAPRD